MDPAAWNMLIILGQRSEYSWHILGMELGTATWEDLVMALLGRENGRGAQRTPNINHANWYMMFGYARHMVGICLAYARHMLGVCLENALNLLGISGLLHRLPSHGKACCASPRPRSWTRRLTNA